MPKAAPTHVIVHRLELQKGLNEELKEYLEAQRVKHETDQFVKVATTAGVVYVGYVGLTFAMRLWASTTALVGGIIDDAQETVEEVVESYVTGKEFVPNPNPHHMAPDIPNPVYGVPVLGPMYTWAINPKVREPIGSRIGRWWVNL